jgi:hypothetical protein
VLRFVKSPSRQQVWLDSATIPARRTVALRNVTCGYQIPPIDDRFSNGMELMSHLLPPPLRRLSGRKWLRDCNRLTSEVLRPITAKRPRWNASKGIRSFRVISDIILHPTLLSFYVSLHLGHVIRQRVVARDVCEGRLITGCPCTVQFRRSPLHIFFLPCLVACFTPPLFLSLIRFTPPNTTLRGSQPFSALLLSIRAPKNGVLIWLGNGTSSEIAPKEDWWLI